MNFKKIIADLAEVDSNLILKSPNQNMGDFCLPCFTFVEKYKKKPQDIALDFKTLITNKKSNLISNMEIVGPYLNFYFNKKYVSEWILNDKNNNSLQNYGKNKTVCIDYCSANLAKYLHIGHISTTVIGESLQRIYKFLGYNVVRINYIGDYGTPFGKMVVAVKLWSSVEEIKEKGIDKIQDLYVKFASNENEELMQEARFASKKIEEKQGEYYEIYKIIIDLSLSEIKRLIQLIGIDFDDWRGESFYNEKINDILKLLIEKKISQIGIDGASIIDLSKENLSVVVVQRSDGGSTYITRDLCAIKDRNNLYHFDEMLYVVAVQQKLYFRQLFKICEMLGFKYAKNLKHISFGMFSTPEGKIASRKGKQALFIDIYQNAYDKAIEIMANKVFEIEDKTKVAKKIAISSIAFSILKVERNKDKIFDINNAITFDGETAPYLQYTYARTCSLIKKFNDMSFNDNEINTEKLNNIYENYFDLFKIINNIKETIIEVKEKAEPYILARELLDLAQVFNKFYNEVKIIDKDNYKTTKEIIKIVSLVKNTLKTYLPLVMVSPVQEM